MKTKVELLKSSIAAIFRRKGKKYITDEEFIFAASMELRWFPPAKAAAFLKNAKRYGLVVASKEGLMPSFDPDGSDIVQIIEAPLEVAEEAQNPVAEIVDIIGSKTREPKSEIMARINKLKRELNIETQAASILVAAQNGIDVSGLAAAALEELMGSYNG